MDFSLVGQKWVGTELQKKATSALCHALSSGAQIAIYGAGQTGKLIAKVLQGVEKKISIFFIDDTPAKLGSFIEGIPVLSVDQAYDNYGKNIFVIICIFSAKHEYSKTKKKLVERFDWQVCTFAQALFLDSTVLPYLYLDDISKQAGLQEQYVNVFTKLADQRSKDVLLENLRARILADFSGNVDSRTELSFLGLAPDANVSFIDCGAYDGDTIQEFIEWRGEKFGKIVAIEPDEVNFNKLANRISKLPTTCKSRIELYQMATWHSVGKISFLSTQSVGSTISEGGDNLVSTITLDSFCSLSNPLIIKLDVEGAEWETVSGSLEFIRVRQPILAISVYHKPNDLLELFEIIDSLKVGYKFFLRCHGGDGTDLTLYCVSSAGNCDELSE